MTGRPGWLARISELRPALLEEANKCEPAYRQSYFSLLVEKALREDSQSIITASAPQAPKNPAPVEENLAGDRRSFPKFEAFAARTDFGLDDLRRIVDLEAGDVIQTSLGKTNSEIQRNLAAILSLRAAALEGSFRIPKGLLKEQCQKFAVYDMNNFTAYMKKAEIHGSRVFIDKDEAWEVTMPGLAFVENFVANFVKPAARSQ